jgi:chitinase
MIAVGVSSYGRSFRMTTPGCWTEQCTFTGPDSGAVKGRCTDTAGYISDYEIEEIIRKNPSAKKYMDQDSYSNIVVWDSNQWVAYMDKNNKATRKALYPALNFLGSADWAVDLQSENGNGGGGKSSSDKNVYIDPNVWNSVSPVVTGSPGVTLIWPPKPLLTPTTISFAPWTTMVTYSSLTTKTSTLSAGGITTYPAYIYVSFQTIITIPPVVTTEIPVWGVSISSDYTSGPIVLTSSVQPPPFTISVTP